MDPISVNNPSLDQLPQNSLIVNHVYPVALFYMPQGNNGLVPELIIQGSSTEPRVLQMKVWLKSPVNNLQDTSSVFPKMKPGDISSPSGCLGTLPHNWLSGDNEYPFERQSTDHQSW